METINRILSRRYLCSVYLTSQVYCEFEGWIVNVPAVLQAYRKSNVIPLRALCENSPYA